MREKFRKRTNSKNREEREKTFHKLHSRKERRVRKFEILREFPERNYVNDDYELLTFTEKRN